MHLPSFMTFIIYGLIVVYAVIILLLFIKLVKIMLEDGDI
jgi:hypothetical protein